MSANKGMGTFAHGFALDFATQASTASRAAAGEGMGGNDGFFALFAGARAAPARAPFLPGCGG
jgi:hypothetical protein